VAIAVEVDGEKSGPRGLLLVHVHPRPFLARPMTTANEATSNLTSAAALAGLIGF